MKQQFIAYPICWELLFDKNRHSVRVFEYFAHQNGRQNNLFGEISAAIAETEDEAKNALILEAKFYFSFLRTVHSTIAEKDVEFCFMVKEIKDGLVSLGRNMVMRERI